MSRIWIIMMWIFTLLWGRTHHKLVLIRQINVVWMNLLLMWLSMLIMLMFIRSTRCSGILYVCLVVHVISHATSYTWSYRTTNWCVDILVLNILQILCFLSKLWCCDGSRRVLRWCKALHMLLGSNLRLDLTWLHCRANRNSWFRLFTSTLALVIVINKSSWMHLLLLELIVSLN